jgi:hypothetical protein
MAEAQTCRIASPVSCILVPTSFIYKLHTDGKQYSYDHRADDFMVKEYSNTSIFEQMNLSFGCRKTIS